MKKLLFAALLLASPAWAADLKAPPLLKASAPPACSLTYCVGWHAGFIVAGSGTGVNVIDLGALSANGTMLGLDGGYQYYNGTYWLGAKVLLAYDVISPNGLPGASFSSKLFAFEGIELGGNLFGALGLAPPQVTGFLSTLTAAVPTAELGACQHGDRNGYCAGATLHYFLPNTPLELKAEYINAQYGSTGALPGQVVNSTENIGLFGATYHF